MSDHLKRYNSKVTIRLNKKEKDFLKKNAYSKKITMSEYIRALIIMDNRLTSLSSHIASANRNLSELMVVENSIRRKRI